MTLSLQEIQNIKHQDDTLEEMKIRLIKAGDRVNQINRSLAEQLSKFLDERSYLENRRVMDIIKDIKSAGIQLKENRPYDNEFISIEGKPSIEMVMDRPLWTGPSATKLRKQEMKQGSSEEVDASILYDLSSIDQRELKSNIGEFLKSDSQVSLRTITEKYPITKGIAEILTYMDIASKSKKAIVNEDIPEIMLISNTLSGKQFKIQIPQIIFCRNEI
jgi:hypothetical protein